MSRITDPDRVIGVEMTVAAEKLAEGDRYLVGRPPGASQYVTITNVRRVPSEDTSQDGDLIRFSWGEGRYDHDLRAPHDPVNIRRPQTPKPKAGNE